MAEISQDIRHIIIQPNRLNFLFRVITSSSMQQSFFIFPRVVRVSQLCCVCRYDQVGCSYLYDIDAHLDISGTGRRSKPFVIDATSQGNVARFINHRYKLGECSYDAHSMVFVELYTNLRFFWMKVLFYPKVWLNCNNNCITRRTHMSLRATEANCI